MLAHTRLGFALLSALGVAIATGLAIHAGLAAIADAIENVGWLGLAWVCALQIVSLALCAAAWAMVADRASFASCLTARWIRDGTSNLVGLIPGLGEVAGARALSLLGATAGVAAASTVVDVAMESLAQAIYTLIGLIPLLLLAEREQATRWLTVIAIATAPILATFIVTRHRGAIEAAERIIIRIAGAFGLTESVSELNLSRDVLDLYRRHRPIAFALILHLAAWGIGAVQVWAAAQAMDRPLSAGAALALESLVYAARGALFFVPWGAGIQEGSFVLVGAVLGINAAGAIALSLILRARDVLVGAPAILVWYAFEGKLRWLKRARVKRKRDR